VPKLKENVEEGSVYVVENILVARNNPKFKIMSHKYKLNCMFSTYFIKIKDDHILINHFDFVSFNEILNSSNKDKIIGNAISRAT